MARVPGAACQESISTDQRDSSDRWTQPTIQAGFVAFAIYTVWLIRVVCRKTRIEFHQGTQFIAHDGNRIMNGIGILLSLAILAQTTIEPLGSTRPPASTGSAATGSLLSSSEGGEVEKYGWQLNENNELEYLVQIAPDMIPFMNRTTGQKEFVSEIPKQLVGRIHRVVVSIGTGPLPRNPSLQDIDRMVPAIASLPPGRMQQLEPDASVVNVNNNQQGAGLPPYPQSYSGQAQTQANPPVNSNVPTTPLGSTFLEGARNGSQNLASGSPNRNSASQPGTGQPSTGQPGTAQPTFGQSGWGQNSSNISPAASGSVSTNTVPLGSTRQFSNTASNTANPQSQRQSVQGNQTDNRQLPSAGWNNSGDTGRFADQRLGGNNNASAWSGNPYPQDPQSLQANGGYPSQYVNNQFSQNQYAQGNQSPSYGQAGFANQNPAFQPGVQGFGDTHGRQGMSIADQMRSTGQWVANSNSNDNYQRNSRSLIAGNSPSDHLQYDGSASASSDYSGRPYDRAGVSGSGLDYDGRRIRDSQQAASDNNYHLFIFFVLSVAVNLWMVHLLRSLYVRYKTLLASLRSQTA